MCCQTRALLLLSLLAIPASAAGGQIYGPGDTLPSAAIPHNCNNWWPIGPSRPSTHGDTILGFKITAEGNVRDVSLLHSSRDAFLDDAAKACVMTWQYKPAMHRNGNPYEVPWIARVSWQLGRGTRPWPDPDIRDDRRSVIMGMPRN